LTATKIQLDGSRKICHWATNDGKPEALNQAAAFHCCNMGLSDVIARPGRADKVT
jgi:hypothetical protein